MCGELRQALTITEGAKADRVVGAQHARPGLVYPTLGSFRGRYEISNFRAVGLGRRVPMAAQRRRENATFLSATFLAVFNGGDFSYLLYYYKKAASISKQSCTTLVE